MSNKHNFVPPGWPSVIPRLAVEDPAALVQFLQQVFGASGDYNTDRPTELWIGESLIMIGNTLDRSASVSFIYVYVEDTDGAFARAVSLGARAIEVPQEMPYGDRRAMIEDRWGNRWQIATHKGFKDHG